MAHANKTLSIFLIILLSFAGLAVIGFFLLALKAPSFNFHFGFGGDQSNTSYYNNLVAEKQYEAKDFNALAINQDYGDIEINSVSPSDDAKIEVKIYAEDSNNAEISENGSEISIKYKAPNCVVFCFNQKGARFVVYVPENFAGTFNIYNDYGKTKIGNFKDAYITAESDYGDVEVGEAKVAKLTLDAGNAKLGNCYGRVDIRNDMGNVDIDKLSITEDSSIILDMGNVSINDVGDVRVITKVDLGNANVQTSNSTSPIILTIENDLGNITVR